jgi:hypothetical protein
VFGAIGVLSLLVLMLALVGVFVFIPFVSQYAFWVAIAAYVILNWGAAGGGGANWSGIFSLFVVMLAVVGVFADIPFVSKYAFWFAIAAYVVRDWTFNGQHGVALLIWTGVLSLLVMMLAVVGVFCEIPFVSNYAFWFVIAAYMIHLLVAIPGVRPNRIGVFHVG